LLELAGKLEVELKDEYTNGKRCKDFVSYIAELIRSDLLCELQNANM
jgi:hypothetical protein